MDACKKFLLTCASIPLLISLSVYYYFTQKMKRSIKRSLNSDEVYEMKRTPSGLCLILNNEKCYGYKPRLGSEKDVQNLKKTFELLNFKVEIERNKTFSQTMKLIKDTRERSDLGDHDAFIFIVMSHGRQGLVYSSDTVAMFYNELFEPFNDENCKYLKNKPKIFFFKTCRGVLAENKENEMQSIASEEQRSKNSDLMLCFAAVIRENSPRHIEHGSPYINALCHTLKENSGIHDLIDILKIVDSRLKDEGESTTNFKYFKFKKFMFKTSKRNHRCFFL